MTEIDDRPRGPIDLGSMSIDTTAIDAADPEATRAPDGSGRYLIVQLGGPATAAELETLAARVDRIYGYLPSHGYLVRVTPGQVVADLGAWAGVVLPAYKIAREVREVEWPAEGAGTEELRTLLVQAYQDADPDRIAAELAGFPEAEVVGAAPGARFSRVRLRLPADRAVAVAEALAELPEVFWIDVEGQRALLNDTTIWVGQSGVTTSRTTPVFDRGIHGEGQVVGFIDTGVDIDSCFYRDPARGLPPLNVCDGGTAVDPDHRKVVAVDFLAAGECAGGILGSEWDSAQSHGTHIGGIIAGDNLARPIVHDTADGMAPGAKLVVQDAGSGADGCGSMPGIGCPVVDLKPFFEQAYAQGARLHSNSWGDRQSAIPHNRYTAASEDVDEFMWTHPDFLLFFATGNSGSNPGTVFSPSTAKNAVSVGATLRAASAESMAVFSGCGPVADGRIKPDLTIPGSSIVSARSDGNVATNNCTTVALSGTSEATPAAAGLGALVRQYYTDGFYPSGTATFADGFAPSAALIKATLINSARQMTSAGAIPANCQGWGRILLDGALFFEGQTRRVFVGDDPGFPQGGIGQEKRFTFLVRANESLKATLVWTDFPSTPAAAVNLVNDLDLEVDGPGGRFLGNVFSGGFSQPGGSADRRNTVEQVLLPNPGPGVYRVTVRAVNVPVGPQPFALVLTGDAALNRPPVADAGTNQTGLVGQVIALDGAASSDPDGLPSPLSYAWTQTDGPPVSLDGADGPVARFTPAALGTYVFQLRIGDGAEESEDSVSVVVVNQPPAADAGPDQTGLVGQAIALDGAASSDPDGLPSPLSFAWTQTAGPPVTIADADSARASFTPAVSGTYTFRLLVSDGLAEADDTTTVTVPAANVVVFADDFEEDRGWTANPGGTDTATTGRWERGQPQPTNNNGLPMQLGGASSGTFALVTGASAGTSVGDNDIDSGTTSIASPPIALPAGPLTLSFTYYLAHLSNSSAADFFRVRMVGAASQTVFEELGTTSDDGAAWQTAAIDLGAFAGQTVQLIVEAADASGASLVEAAVDDVMIEGRL